MDNTESIKKILDLGCGTNPHEGVNVIMDNNPIINDLPGQYEKHVYDLSQIPYPFEDCSVDEIYCTQVLEHLNVHTFEFLQECYRILKPMGQLHLELPNAFYITSRIRFLLGTYVQDTSFHPFHAKLLKPSYIMKHFRHIGFNPKLKWESESLWKSCLKRISPDLFCRGIYITARKRP